MHLLYYISRCVLLHNIYCEQTLREDQHSFKCGYSMMLIIQINFLLYEMETGKTEWGVRIREGEREREEQIK